MERQSRLQRPLTHLRLRLAPQNHRSRLLLQLCQKPSSSSLRGRRPLWFSCAYPSPPCRRGSTPVSSCVQTCSRRRSLRTVLAASSPFICLPMMSWPCGILAVSSTCYAQNMTSAASPTSCSTRGRSLTLMLSHILPSCRPRKISPGSWTQGSLRVRVSPEIFFCCSTSARLSPLSRQLRLLPLLPILRPARRPRPLRRRAPGRPASRWKRQRRRPSAPGRATPRGRALPPERA